MFVSAQKIIILTFTVIEILATTIECCIVDGREAPTLSCACHGKVLWHQFKQFQKKNSLVAIYITMA
jgi:hypothetical protein